MRTTVTLSPDVLSGVPQTGEEYQSLRIKIDALREQLQDAASRRSNISGQLRGADGASRPGIEARMGELDSRILQIERDITTATIQMSNAPVSARLAGTRMGVPANNMDPQVARIVKDIVPIFAILCVFVLGPFAVAMSRLIWKRASNLPSRAPVTDQATQQRLEQLQQSVDTIAIEVERISEGQRFVTKLLSERPALGAGGAEPVRAPKKSAVPSEHG